MYLERLVMARSVVKLLRVIESGALLITKTYRIQMEAIIQTIHIKLGVITAIHILDEL